VCYVGMDDVGGEPDVVGGWLGSVLVFLHVSFSLCHTFPTASS
jgi:hypothetical protein